MGQPGLKSLNVEQLIECFTAHVIGNADIEAACDDPSRLFRDDTLEALRIELRSRGAEGRNALCSFWQHPNENLRKVAAKAAFVVPQSEWKESERIRNEIGEELVRRGLRTDRKSTLRAMTVGQLVERFAEIAIAQSETLQRDQYGKYNRLYRLMDNIEAELKSRAGDQRRALAPLFKHQNAHVRLKAAIRALAVAPEAARQTLQAISNWNEYPQAADARGILSGLDDGSYKPS